MENVEVPDSLDKVQIDYGVIQMVFSNFQFPSGKFPGEFRWAFPVE